MPTRAGQITIDVSAGTAKFVTDISTAKAKLRELGETGSASHREMAATMKLVEGNLKNNSKAVDEFLMKLPGVGAAVKTMFPLVGAIAFAGVLGEIGGKVFDFFKELKYGPEKVGGAFRDLGASMRLGNDQLGLTAANLENTIAKLEGRKENNLKVALEEAKVAADNLAKSLEGDLAQIYKLLEEHKVDLADQFFGGEMSDKGLREELGGKTGVGGSAKTLNDINERGIAGVAAGASEKEQAEARRRWNAELEKYYKDLGAALKQQADAKRADTSRGFMTSALTGAVPQDKASILEKYDYAQSISNQAASRYKAQGVVDDLEAKARAAQIAHDNQKTDRPLDKTLKELDAQIGEANAKLKAAGLDEANKLIAKAQGDALKAIQKVNEEMAKQGPLAHQIKPGDKDARDIETNSLALEKIKAEGDWQEKLAQTTAELKNQTQAREMLTAAIGEGYEATKRANIEVGLMGKVGAEHYNDTKWMADHAADVASIRSGLGKDIDSQHSEQSTKAIQSLKEQIELENALAGAYRLGAEAVRQETIEITAKHMRANSATEEEIGAYRKLEQAKKDAANAKGLASTDQEIQDIRNMSTAIMQGAEAERKAALEIGYAKMKTGGATDQEVADKRYRDELEHQNEITKAAFSAGNAYSDKLAKIDEEIDALDGVKGREIDLLALEKERLHVMSEQALATGRAADGARAVFLEMQANAKTTGQIIYDSIKQAVEGSENVVAKNLSDLASGQYKKGEFGKDMQRQAGSQLQSFLKMGMEKLTGGHKPTGTASDPIHVVTGADKGTGATSGAMGKLAGMAGKIPGVGGWLQKLLGGASSGGAPGADGIQLPPMQKAYDTSGAAFGAMGDAPIAGAFAGGGDMDPGSAYLVGENGPEIMTPRSAGTITPIDKLGGDVHHHSYNIDARGAALGVENRIASSIQAAHDAAVTNAVKTSNERSKRTPQRKG